jgi:hypothetical protein
MGTAVQRYLRYRDQFGAKGAAKLVGTELKDPRVTERLAEMYPDDPAVPARKTVEDPRPAGPAPVLTQEELNRKAKELEDRLTDAAVRLYKLYLPRLGAVEAAKLAGKEMGNPIYLMKLQGLFPEACGHPLNNKEGAPKEQHW